jgi:hypothetical protein
MKFAVIAFPYSMHTDEGTAAGPKALLQAGLGCVSRGTTWLALSTIGRALRANDDETNTCREFTLGGVGQTSSGYAPNQRQQDSCSSRRG